MQLIPVILAGGIGSRLWPASRASHPKPFIPLPDGETLIQKTFARACSLEGVEEILTVTNQELYFKTEDEYQKFKNKACLQSFILEPFGRNTAAAITSAALHLQTVHGSDTQLLVLAADHLIKNQQAFTEAVTRARNLAAENWLVTFGIEPDSPESGFGYIEADREKTLKGGMVVKKFVEKPDLQTAKLYFESGNYFWNSGMFCFRIGSLIDELANHSPEIINSVHSTLRNSRLCTSENHRSIKLNADIFATVPDISIDYALMEKSSKVATVPCNIDWCDVGSWTTMGKLSTSDSNNNFLEGEVITHSAKNNIVQSHDRLTALVGVEDLIIVDTPDALLVANKNKDQEVKHIVNQLKENAHEAHFSHRKAHRPWGTYTVLEEGERFKIKRIAVKPGASLSLQMHHHRSEHWVVVSGMARIVNGNHEILLGTNESTYIAAGNKHRLENPGIIELVLIEIQSGDYLGEDDIVRFEDNYGRSE
ncbi:MAG: mannose-1-phosphate guanylyltransferase/mannose-6-phosphate isomerase [Gammaproteobacteria bacterium]|nr:mannose-1-phosphate guanylyltransferase/mannose-6-phosphate isomerase [Gammaproteobacteria bacterium]